MCWGSWLQNASLQAGTHLDTSGMWVEIIEQEEVGGVTRTEMWIWARLYKPCCLTEGFSTEMKLIKCVNMHRGTWGSTRYNYTMQHHHPNTSWSNHPWLLVECTKSMDVNCSNTQEVWINISSIKFCYEQHKHLRTDATNKKVLHLQYSYAQNMVGVHLIVSNNKVISMDTQLSRE